MTSCLDGYPGQVGDELGLFLDQIQARLEVRLSFLPLAGDDIGFGLRAREQLL